MDRPPASVHLYMRALAAATLLLTACAAADPVNPSLPISPPDARAALRDMRADPKPLTRPLLVLGGFADPLGADFVAGRLRPLVTGEIVPVSFAFADDFEEARDILAHAAAGREVDVVAVSMGGLVARYAAPHVRIARLFTIATPHAGAHLADLPSPDPFMQDMQRDSEFMTRLNTMTATYELLPYAALGDLTVGTENAAPPGDVPWWTAQSPVAEGHVAAALDPRILADIARRLRGEPAYATTPRAPLPEN